MSDNFLKRIMIFLNERYPIVVGLVSSIVGVLSMFCIWAGITPGATIKFSLPFFMAVISFFVLMLILRLCDEIKDKEVDAELFPERCLPAGKVSYKDINILLIISSLIFLVTNYLWGGDKTILLVLVVYVFLFYKYFFFPKFVSQNILIALITSNPLMFVSSLYILSFFAKDQGLPIFNMESILLAIGFWMPSLVWETSRKIRAPHRETTYQTYSLMMGPRLACMLPLGGLFIQLAIIIYLVKDLNSGHLIVWGASLLFLLYFIQYFLFLITLKSRFSRYFQLITEAHIIANSSIIVLVSTLEVFK